MTTFFDEPVLFHDVGCLFPGETVIKAVPGDTSVADALSIMLQNNYSQMPVTDNGVVRGVFSLRSLAANSTRLGKIDLGQLPVEEFMESIPFVSVKDSLHGILNLLDKHDALLVGSEEKLQAIATTYDVLKYFYSLAKPYILLWEIELGLRTLIDLAVPPSVLGACIKAALGSHYERIKRPCPASLEEMTFEDYRTLLGCKENWPHFQTSFGRREVVLARLAQVRDIRNDVFHFRDGLTFEKHHTLASSRDWILDKIKKAKRASEEGDHVKS